MLTPRVKENMYRFLVRQASLQVSDKYTLPNTIAISRLIKNKTVLSDTSKGQASAFG